MGQLKNLLKCCPKTKRSKGELMIIYASFEKINIENVPSVQTFEYLEN